MLDSVPWKKIFKVKEESSGIVLLLVSGSTQSNPEKNL